MLVGVLVDLPRWPGCRHVFVVVNVFVAGCVFAAVRLSPPPSSVANDSVRHVFFAGGVRTIFALKVAGELVPDKSRLRFVSGVVLVAVVVEILV